MAIAGAVDQALSVMVIDDDDFSCTLLRDMLSAQGVTEIHTASDGRAALASLSSQTRAPDMLICDLFMPEMDGIEFMEALAKRKYAGSVVLVSGGNTDMLQIAQMLGRNDGIRVLGSYAKPLHRDTLASLLHESCQPAHLTGALERA